jgi:hypothetical protein
MASNTDILGPASAHPCVRCGKQAESCSHARILARTEPGPNGCWLWTGARKRVRTRGQSYGNVWLEGRFEVAHRVFYRLLVGPIPEGQMVLHQCDVGLCVNPDHLHLGTAAQNSAEMVERGRSSIGNRNGQAKLTEADVVAIRQAVAEGARRQLVASSYGISRAQVDNVVGRRAWRHVP